MTVNLLAATSTSVSAPLSFRRQQALMDAARADGPQTLRQMLKVERLLGSLGLF